MTTMQMGEEGFRWFLGIVEDIVDPMKLGRVKVRIINEYEEGIETGDIEWAHVMLPTTSGSVQGVGDTPNLSVGSNVIGFFLDSQEKQLMMILGSYPTIPNMEDDKHSISYLARGKQIIDKEPVAPEPPSAYAAEYPYNRVIQTRSGHVIELDDTPQNERVHIYHKAGTYIEINTDGRMVIKCKDNSFEIVEKDKHLQVNGNLNVRVIGDMNALVEGKTTFTSKGDINITSGGKLTLKAKDGIKVESPADMAVKTGGGLNATKGGITALGAIQSAAGISGSFTTPTGKQVQVTKGIITNITKA